MPVRVDSAMKSWYRKQKEQGSVGEYKNPSLERGKLQRIMSNLGCYSHHTVGRDETDNETQVKTPVPS